MKCSKCGNRAFVKTNLSLRIGGENEYLGHGLKRLRTEAIVCTKCASVELYANKEQIKRFLDALTNYEKIESQLKVLNEERANFEKEVSDLRSEKKELEQLSEKTGKDYSIKIADLKKKINLLTTSKRKLDLDNKTRKTSEEVWTAKRILDSFNSELILFES
jgi:predicted nucleic-acid-binding Zn-ribbon protein